MIEILAGLILLVLVWYAYRDNRFHSTVMSGVDSIKAEQVKLIEENASLRVSCKVALDKIKDLEEKFSTVRPVLEMHSAEIKRIKNNLFTKKRPDIRVILDPALLKEM